MTGVLTSPWLVTVISGMLVALISALIAYMMRRRQTPALLALYERALHKVCSNELILNNDKRILRQVLCDSSVVEAIETEIFGPDEETSRLCNTVARFAPPSSSLADATYATKVIEQLLRTEFMIESTYPAYHESKRYERRREFFEQMKSSQLSERPTEREKPLSQQAQPPVRSVMLSPFFNPLEHLQGLADACIGRREDLSKLQADFADVNQRLIVIEGFGGLGKTTLATRLAKVVSQQYTILWVDCEGIAVTAERFLLEMGHFASDYAKYPWLATVVENPSLSIDEKINGLLEFFAHIGKPDETVTIDTFLNPIALFFDDYHLVKDPALDRLVEKITESHVDIKVVLIIRYRQHLSTKLQSKVTAADPILLDGLSFEDCRSFINLYAKKFSALRNLDEQLLQLIWQRTGKGIPNALNILSSMAQTRSLHDILEQLPDYDPLTAATRKQWLDGLFNELSPDEQQVAAELSIFRRPASRQVLIRVSRYANADEVIDALVYRFVLTFDGELYSMHSLWSEYTKSLLPLTEMKHLHARAATYYHEFASENRHIYIMNHLESCYHFIKADDIEKAEMELTPIADTLQSWGIFQELIDILAEIEKVAREVNQPLSPYLRMIQSAVLHARGEVERSVAILNDLIRINDGETKINALNRLAWINIEIGNRREAEHLFKQSIQLAKQYKLFKLEGKAIHGLENIAYGESNYAKAIKYNERRLKIYQQVQEDSEAREEIALAYRSLANIYREQGFYDKALKLYFQNLDIWHSLGDPVIHVGWLTYDIAQVLFELGNLQQAQKKFEETLKLFEKIQYVHGVAHAMIELGRVRVKLNQDYASIEYVEEAINLMHRIKLVAGEAYGLRALGEIYLILGEPDHALAYLQQSLSIDENILHGVKGIASSLHRISLVYEYQAKQLLDSGNRTEAVSRFQDAQATIEKAQSLFVQLQSIPNFGGIHDDALRIQAEYNTCNIQSDS